MDLIVVKWQISNKNSNKSYHCHENYLKIGYLGCEEIRGATDKNKVGQPVT